MKQEYDSQDQQRIAKEFEAVGMFSPPEEIAAQNRASVIVIGFLFLCLFIRGLVAITVEAHVQNQQESRHDVGREKRSYNPDRTLRLHGGGYGPCRKNESVDREQSGPLSKGDGQ